MAVWNARQRSMWAWSPKFELRHTIVHVDMLNESYDMKKGLRWTGMWIHTCPTSKVQTVEWTTRNKFQPLFRTELLLVEQIISKRIGNTPVPECRHDGKWESISMFIHFLFAMYQTWTMTLHNSTYCRRSNYGASFDRKSNYGASLSKFGRCKTYQSCNFLVLHVTTVKTREVHN